jgi:hypothetical protein
MKNPESPAEGTVEQSVFVGEVFGAGFHYPGNPFIRPDRVTGKIRENTGNEHIIVGGVPSALRVLVPEPRRGGPHTVTEVSGSGRCRVGRRQPMAHDRQDLIRHLISITRSYQQLIEIIDKFC